MVGTTSGGEQKMVAIGRANSLSLAPGFIPQTPWSFAAQSRSFWDRAMIASKLVVS